MKALSVRGDYIMDIIAGKKKIEYRTWKTNYRGPLLMCSYYWNIELVDVIKPIHVKGQLKLFNVDDDLIKPISRKEFESEIRPLIYMPKRRKKSNKKLFQMYLEQLNK